MGGRHGDGGVDVDLVKRTKQSIATWVDGYFKSRVIFANFFFFSSVVVFGLSRLCIYVISANYVEMDPQMWTVDHGCSPIKPTQIDPNLENYKHTQVNKSKWRLSRLPCTEN